MAMDIAPEDQDKLAQLMGGKLGGGNVAQLFANAAKNVTPGDTGAPPMQPPPGSRSFLSPFPPDLVDSQPRQAVQTAPIVQTAPMRPPPSMTSAPVGVPGMAGGGGMPIASRVTDDPALQPKPATSPMPGAPALPVPPIFQQPPVDRMQELNRQISDASKPINRDDYKPKWWQRLLAVPIAIAASRGGNIEGGINAVRRFEDRDYNRALDTQQRRIAPLEAEFKRYSETEPFINTANTNTQRTFEDQDAAYKNFNATQDRQAAVQTRQDAENRREEEDKSTPAPGARPELTMVNGKPTLVVRTKSGEKIPYTAKSIDEGAMFGDPTAQRLYSQAHPGKEGDKEANKAQFRLIEGKHQDALNQAEDEYTQEIQQLDQTRAMMTRGGKAAPDDSAARTAAGTRLQQKKDRAERSYQAEIVAAGGSINPADRLPKGGAAAQPAGSNSAGAKSTTKSVVQSYADSHKMTYDQALKGFQSKGYQVK